MTEGTKGSDLSSLSGTIAGTDLLYVMRSGTSRHAQVSALRITGSQISTATTAGLALLAAADVPAQRAALGLGGLALLSTVAAAQLGAKAVTLAKMDDLANGSTYIGDGTNRPIAFATSSIGQLLMAAATKKAARDAIAAGSLFYSTTPIGNVGAGEDDLLSTAIPAGQLAADGDSLEVRAAGSFATSANSKRLRAYFGAGLLFDSTALAITTAADWTLVIQIIRTGAATQTALATFTSGSTVLSATCTVSAPTETLSGSVTLKLTGEATADNDIVAKAWKGSWISTP